MISNKSNLQNNNYSAKIISVSTGRDRGVEEENWKTATIYIRGETMKSGFTDNVWWEKYSPNHCGMK